MLKINLQKVTQTNANPKFQDLSEENSREKLRGRFELPQGSKCGWAKVLINAPRSTASKGNFIALLTSWKPLLLSHLHSSLMCSVRDKRKTGIKSNRSRELLTFLSDRMWKDVNVSRKMSSISQLCGLKSNVYQVSQKSLHVWMAEEKVCGRY